MMNFKNNLGNFKEYFKTFSSNTYAGSANQLYFKAKEKHTGRIFYKISDGGKYNYSILFSNIIDSTYSDGKISHKNLICDEWVIHSSRIERCRNLDKITDFTEYVMNDKINSEIEVSDFKDICFDGCKSKLVVQGELFSSDPIEYEFEKNEFLCLEITFSGEMIPYHEETLLPVFVKEKETWKCSKFMPFASMIGCDRPVKGRVAYLGDSITQGIGTEINSYLHWNALLSEKIGNE